MEPLFLVILLGYGGAAAMLAFGLCHVRRAWSRRAVAGLVSVLMPALCALLVFAPRLFSAHHGTGGGCSGGECGPSQIAAGYAIIILPILIFVMWIVAFVVAFVTAALVRRLQ